MRIPGIVYALVTLVIAGICPFSRASDDMDYRMVSVPFDESIQIIIKQRQQYAEVLWAIKKNEATVGPYPLYMIFIEHHGIEQPGFLNRKFREYNIKLEDTSSKSDYRVFKRADAETVRSLISKHLFFLASIHSYPEREIIEHSQAVVLFLYELDGIIPRVNLNVFRNGEK